MHTLDYSGLDESQISGIENALATDPDDLIVGYIPDKMLAFVLRNYKRLAELGILERNWMTAYVHASHLNDYPLARIRDVFDTCDKAILQKHYPIPATPSLGSPRFSIFRGCAGPDHRMGMSWITSLDKAIWYASQHAEYRDLTNQAVYATTVDRSEIYCCGDDHYDRNEHKEYIVLPKTWWKVTVPISEFRLDRPR